MSLHRMNGCRQLVVPAFFAVGPPRTGTTWLHHALKKRVNLPRYTEEVRFFDTYYSKGLGWYSSQFGPTNALLLTGETCSTYFYSGAARERIAQLVPNAKILCTFRDPMDRLLSLYRAKRVGGLLAPMSFRDALRSDPEFLESSRYAFHLTQWRKLFGSSNVYVAIYDDLLHRPQRYVDDILDFIGVPRFQLTPEQLHFVNSFNGAGAPWSFHLTHAAALVAQWLRTRRMAWLVVALKKTAARRMLLGGGGKIESPDAATVRSVRDFFRPEVERLEAMTGRDLSTWKGMGSPISPRVQMS